MSYDQWKTASPYDDEPDPMQGGANWIHKHRRVEETGVDAYWPFGKEMADAYWIIKGLLEYIDENV